MADNNETSKKRFLDIDTIRGLAMVGMVIYHAAFVINFYDVMAIDLSAANWRLIQRTVQFAFIGLVGVSMNMSKKTRGGQIKRGAFIIGCGMLVTLATYIAIPEYYVRFGILHFVGTGIIVMSFFKGNPRAIAAIAIGSLVLGKFVAIPPTGPTVDYFPIFPWISVIAAGMLIPSPRFSVETNFISKTLGFLGRHSLILYLVHVPVILGILLAFTYNTGMISWWVLPLAMFGFLNAGYIWWKKSRKEKIKCLIGNGGCDAVVNSRYNSIFGVENEIMGMAFYAGIGGAVLFVNLIASSIQEISLVMVLFIIESIALLVSGVLTAIQAFILKQWCEYCILSTVINAFIWALTFFATPKIIS